MAKAKDPGIILDDATVDTPLPDVESFRVTYKERIFRCRESISKGRTYFYIERSHRKKKLHQFICKPGELNAVLIREAAEELLVEIEKREAEYQAKQKTEKDLRTLIMELQAEIASLSEKVDTLVARQEKLNIVVNDQEYIDSKKAS
ncbi:hypothetical protein Riv7116_6292 [Rivularia sp. PCC 7116]|uniref:hypothetical protein n=1 Tax=Rivularia sp. PCC 7116 TaxID=373994 RepID=UPI00029F163B|nr:hypothetical protein [Rivularia sp. PCC 7116]AFY58639.1 hypothetical protein Riv7116_6292 [Rivularia sp. PCC 7116]